MYMHDIINVCTYTHAMCTWITLSSQTSVAGVCYCYESNQNMASGELARGTWLHS